MSAYQSVTTLKRFVITGTSGTGKSALVNELRSVGTECFEEAARKILTSGSELAKKDVDVFVREMLSQSLSDYQAASPTGIKIFDRGIPDTIAYAFRFGVPLTEFEEASRTYRYEDLVFMTPPWSEIFQNDEVRTAPFEDYVRFHDLILETYGELGYKLLEIPKLPVHERVEFVQSYI